MPPINARLTEPLFQAAQQIRGARTPAAICQALVAFAASLGFDRLIVCSISTQARQDLVGEVFFTQGDWGGGRSAQERESYLLHCPITQHLLEQDHPFFWTKTSAGEDNRLNYRIIRQAAERGEVSGVQLPVFGRAGLEGAVSLAGELNDMSPELLLVVQAVCNLAFHELKRRRQAPLAAEPTSLTPREREILRWAAAGRKQGEIAEVLAISERTVENHLRSVRRRLGVASTAQAVAQALAQGEIDV